MRGVSRESLAEGQERLETFLTSPGADPAALGDALFAVTDVLAANPGLRRALTDPARDGEAKAALVQRLFGGRIEGGAVDLVAGLVRARWGEGGDLTDAVALGKLRSRAGSASDMLNIWSGDLDEP